MSYLKNLRSKFPVTPSEADELRRNSEFIDMVDGELYFGPTRHLPSRENCNRARIAELRVEAVRRSVRERRLRAIFLGR